MKLPEETPGITAPHNISKHINHFKNHKIHYTLLVVIKHSSIRHIFTVYVQTEQINLIYLWAGQRISLFSNVSFRLINQMKKNSFLRILKWNFIVGSFWRSITYLQDCKGSKP